METITFHVGAHIMSAAHQLVSYAAERHTQVQGVFNDITLTAEADSKVEDIVVFYHAERERRAEAYRNSPEGKKAIARQEREAREYRERAAAAAAEGFKPFAIKYPAQWQQFLNHNNAGLAILRYAARWAHLMEQQMAAGAQLEDIAEKASHEADLEGMSGFTHGIAVSILVQVWEYGERLRRWHNLDTQIGDEGEQANETGGVLNPALVGIARR